MVATEDETISRAASNCFHTSSICLDARRFRIVETPAVHRAPEIRVQLEIGAAPFLPHRSEKRLEVSLYIRMAAVECVPRPPSPAGESHLIRGQRFSVRAFHE